MQLASRSLTAAPTDAARSQQDDVESCGRASLSHQKQLTSRSTVAVLTGPPAVASCNTDAVNCIDTGRPMGPLDSSLACAKSPATSLITQEEDTLDSRAFMPPAANSNIALNEAVVVPCCVTAPQQPTTLLAIHTSGWLQVCAVKTGENISVINSISSAGPACPQVSWGKPPTVPVPSVPSVSFVKNALSSVDEPQPTLAAGTACGNDVAMPAGDTVSEISNLTVSSSMSRNLTITQSSELPVDSIQAQVCPPVAGNLTITQVAGLPVDSIQTQLSPPVLCNLAVAQAIGLPVVSVHAAVQDTLASTDSPQLRENVLDTLSPLDDSSKVPIREVKNNMDTSKSLTPTTSVSPSCATKAVAPALGFNDVSVANAVNVLTSLRALSKLQPNETADKLQAASPSRKRPRRVSTKVSAEISSPAETEEERAKYAKLDETVIASSVSTQLPVGDNNDVSFAATVTGSADAERTGNNVSSAAKAAELTDSERISCYKTIGAREERSRVIGLKAADRLRRRTAPAEKAPASADSEQQSPEPAAVRSADESRSSGLSRSSPRKPARRVPLVTVLAAPNAPATPTLFTLRSRARLAQLQQQETQSKLAESQPCAAQTSVLTTSPAVRGSVDQAATSKELRPANLGVSVTGRCRESARSKTVQPQAVEKMQLNQSDSVPDRTNSRQLRSSQKPSSDVTPSTASGQLATSKQSSAARLSADVSKLTVASKSATPVTVKTTSVGPKTLDVTVSEPDNDGSVAVSGGKTGARTRFSPRKCGTSERSGIVVSRNVQDNPSSSLSCHEPHSVKAGNDKKSDAEGTRAQTSSKTSSRSKSEREKLQQGASEDRKNTEHMKQMILPNENVPSAAAAADAVKRVKKDSRSGTRQNLNGRSNQPAVLRDVPVERGNKTKPTDAAALQNPACVAASKPPNSSTTASVMSSDFLASEKNLSRAIDANVNSPHVVGKTSAATNVSYSVVGSLVSHVAEKQLSATAVKQQMTVSSIPAPVANHGLPLTRMPSVDLFDVAIAGTPSQYANGDNSSDNSLSPFDYPSVDLANEGACEEMASAAEFVVPGNPAGEMVTASPFGKCVFHAGNLASVIQFV